MASVAAEERKSHVLELRKAHFQFGFDTDTKHLSTAKNPLPVQKSAKVRPMSSVVQNQPDRPQLTQFEVKKQLQQNHYKLGVENAPNMYETINQSSFTRPQTATQRATLSDETKNDLRKHHFQLGFHQVDAPTEYKQNYIRQQSAANINTTNQEALRKHNHDFGDRNSYYSSMYDQLHNKQYDTKLLGQKLSKESITQHVVELRKTNLVLGRDQPDYITQSHAVHNQEPKFRDNFMKDTKDMSHLIKQSHIQVGSDAPQYQSEAKGRFQGAQPENPAKLDEATKKDLRATHFKVGNESNQYQTTAQAFYKQPPSQDFRQFKNPEIQKTHIKLEETCSTYKPDEHYQSAYKQQFGGVPVQKNMQARTQQQDRRSNIKLGDDVNNERFTSEAGNNYRDHKVPPSQLEVGVKADLKSHHYQFGTDAPNFVSQTKHIHKHEQGVPARLEDHLKKDLRAHHFTLGFTKGDYVTHSKEIGSKQGPPNRLDPETAMRIKASAQ